MDESEGTQSVLNPWDGRGSALGINLGDPARVLTLGRKHGLLSQASSQEMEEDARRKVPEYGSMEMITQLQEMAQLHDELHQLDLQCYQLLQDKDTADLTHADQLEGKLARVNELVTHLSGVLERKEVVLGQLQTTAAENSVKVEAPYQMHAHKVLTSLGESVTTLPANLSSLEWANHLQIEKTQLAKKLSHGEETLAQCQSTYQTSHRLHQVQSSQNS